MDLKICRRILDFLYAATVFLGVASFFFEPQAVKLGLLGVALALLLASILLRNRLFRCPKCGQLLSIHRPIHCSFCNWTEVS